MSTQLAVASCWPDAHMSSPEHRRTHRHLVQACYLARLCCWFMSQRGAQVPWQKWKRKCLSLRGHKQCHRKGHGDMQLSEVAGLTQQKCSIQLNRHLTCHNLHCMAHYDAGSPGTFATLWTITLVASASGCCRIAVVVEPSGITVGR